MGDGMTGEVRLLATIGDCLSALREFVEQDFGRALRALERRFDQATGLLLEVTAQ
jgi:hypothetical protein